MRKVKKRDSEVVSTSSTTSKTSTDKHKPPRFSLRRIFYIRRTRAKSFGSLDSESGRSEFSVNAPSGRSEVGASAPFDRVSISPNTVAFADTSQLSSLNKSQRTQDSEASLAPTSGVLRECPLCLSECNIEKFPELTSCSHRSCIECFRQYLKIEITESRINITCPECMEKLHPSDIEKILQDISLTQKYESFMVRRVLVLDPDARWCPAPDCGYAVIASGCAGCPKLRCERPGCGTFFCYHCKQSWHPNQTCDAARRERSPNIRSGSISNSHETGSQKDDIKPCPRCGAFIVKMNDGSCNHMTCAVCGAEFCWLCMKEISDLHYLSPSGCTFWGKRPWSRKKKILWQLGTLAGAPIGITLIAGIAVPAMIIGIPVWVVRKIYSRFQHSNKHRKYLAIAGGLTGSVLVSPVVAGLAVGIGVPILLAYVYCVVPVSLCRSGGCGVSTKKSGVRFEFDEQENIGAASPYAGDNHSVETTHHVANPSIAPSIGEASMGMTNSLSASGSHMDKIGVIRDESDRESASTRAVAGSSLNGSLCGSSYTGVSTYQNKLEVQVDISENQAMGKRNSFSSESANFSIGEKSVANFSIGEKSVTISYGDDASTKALAGSIAGYRDKDSISSAISHYECPSDIVSNTSRSRQHSGGSISGNEKSAPKLGPQGSPVLDCRSTVHFDEANVHSSKCRKCKKYSLSVGDKIHEQASSNLSYDESISSCPIVNNTTIKETELNDPAKKLSSVEDVLCDENSCGNKLNKTVSLTEVETDRPLLNDECCPKNANKPLNMGLQKKKNLSHSFNSVYPRDSSSLRCGPQSPRFRRLSCELALEHGRLPLTEIK